MSAGANQIVIDASLKEVDKKCFAFTKPDVGSVRGFKEAAFEMDRSIKRKGMVYAGEN